jgi:hypothetical protein
MREYRLSTKMLGGPSTSLIASRDLGTNPTFLYSGIQCDSEPRGRGTRLSRNAALSVRAQDQP